MSKLYCGEQPRAWAVCTACVLVHFLGLGFSYSMGVYYVVFLDVYGQSSSMTAWISCLNYGFLCFTGPVASLVIQKFGFRAAMMIGGLVSVAGLLAGAFAPNIWIVFLGLGALTGVGMGFTYTTGVVVVGLHFTRWRSLALGISINGAGLGTVLQPLLNVAFIDYYGWRSALIMMGAITLHVCVCAMALPSEQPHEDNQEPTTTDKAKLATTGQPAKQPLHTSLGLILFVRLGFCLIFLNTILFCMAMLAFYTHISAYAQSIGQSKNQGASLISLAGVGSLVGRLLTSVASQYLCHPAIVITVCYTFSATAILAMTFLTSYPAMVVLAFCYGLGQAAVGPALADAVMYVTGKKGFNMGYGWNGVAQGFSLVGGPLAGFMYDMTHSYPASFYLTSALSYLSAVIIFIVWFTDRVPYDQRKTNLPALTVDCEKPCLEKHQEVDDPL